MKRPVRNTRTARLCPECEGAGSFVVNDTNPYGYGPDPQCDRDVSCGECYGRGWIRWAPYDSLVTLHSWRRDYLQAKASGWRPFMQKIAHQNYLSARHQACGPRRAPRKSA